jgi:hypothetical protein
MTVSAQAVAVIRQLTPQAVDDHEAALKAVALDPRTARDCSAWRLTRPLTGAATTRPSSTPRSNASMSWLMAKCPILEDEKVQIERQALVPGHSLPRDRPAGGLRLARRNLSSRLLL